MQQTHSNSLKRATSMVCMMATPGAKDVEQFTKTLQSTSEGLADYKKDLPSCAARSTGWARMPHQTDLPRRPRLQPLRFPKCLTSELALLKIRPEHGFQRDPTCTRTPTTPDGWSSVSPMVRSLAVGRCMERWPAWQWCWLGLGRGTAVTMVPAALSNGSRTWQAYEDHA